MYLCSSSVSRMKKVLRRKINVCTYIFNCAVERRFYRIYLGITFIDDATRAVNAMLLICPKNETGPLHLNHIAMKNKEQKTQTEASATTQAQPIQAECNKDINVLFIERTRCSFLLCYYRTADSASSQGRVDGKTGNPTKILLVSGKSNETFFTPSGSPAEKKDTHSVCNGHTTNLLLVHTEYNHFLCDFSIKFCFTCSSRARSLVLRMYHSPPPGQRD